MTASRAESLMRLEQEVGVMIRRVKRVIGERAHAVHPDLQPASYLMLAYLGQHGPMRASTVADLFSIDKGAISRQVTHLIELGLIEKSRDPEDGRAWLLTATPDARQRLEQVAVSRRRYLADRLDGWEAGDLEAFTHLLARYNESLGAGTEVD